MNIQTKHENVRKRILNAIRAKRFLPGCRLPSERKLAEQYNVSYMTARKVVTGLVESEFLERRGNKGIYVQPSAPARISATTLHLICTAYEKQAMHDFLNFGNLAAERRGWRPNIIRFHPDLMRPVILALRSGEPCLAWVEEHDLRGSLMDEFLAAGNNVVLIGIHCDEISTVMLDDVDSVRQAVAYLRSMGHEKIGMVTADPRYKFEVQRLAAWRECFGDVNPDLLYQRVINVYTPPFERGATYAYKATLEYLNSKNKDERVTAFISSSEEITLGVMAAYRDSGFTVPDDISIINHGDSDVMCFSNPPVTCIDQNLEEHISEAMKLIELGQRNESSQQKYHHLVPTVLIKRKSVSRINEK